MWLYDRIGAGYGQFRQADPLVVDLIVNAAPAGERIVDVGCGTGNYSRAVADRGLSVVGVEPSAKMREQAPPHSRVEYREGCAEELPLPDGHCAAASCVLALSHFKDLERSFAEMDRVTNRGTVVLVFVDPREAEQCWLHDYLPQAVESNVRRTTPVEELRALASRLFGRAVAVQAHPLPEDFRDLFFGAGWKKPALVLDSDYQQQSSSLALAASAEFQQSLSQLEGDLRDGTFEARYAALAGRTHMDVGLRSITVAPA